MIEQIQYCLNKATVMQVIEHLSYCDADFIPPLSHRIKIIDYAQKITNKGTRFEAWADDVLVGLVAAYCNDKNKINAYITNVSVLKLWTGQGIAKNLLERCTLYLAVLEIRRITLKVEMNNVKAIQLYKKIGFFSSKVNKSCITMNLYLKAEEQNEYKT